jgi:hypothetical protein
MTETNPAPPDDLGAAGRELHDRLTAGIVFRPDEWAVVVLACRTADTLAVLAEAMDGQPLLTTGSTGQPVVHPLILELRAQRDALARLLSRIPLPDDDEDEASEARRRRSAAASRAAKARWHGSAAS